MRPPVAQAPRQLHGVAVAGQCRQAHVHHHAFVGGHQADGFTQRAAAHGEVAQGAEGGGPRLCAQLQAAGQTGAVGIGIQQVLQLL
jgi:hypothetical protein